MKKYIAMALAAAIALSLCACGRKDKNPTDDTKVTDDTLVTIPDPTLDTNIPDPTVDSNSTENGSLIDDITDMPGENNNG
jgi:PBP1b-binding outer membrane lipoprotein LpoB